MNRDPFLTPVGRDSEGEWFDHWIDTLTHPDTQLFAARWSRGERTHEYAIGIQPGEKKHKATAHRLGVYDKEIQ